MKATQYYDVHHFYAIHVSTRDVGRDAPAKTTLLSLVVAREVEYFPS